MFGVNPFTIRMPTPEQALPGRAEPMPVVDRHAVLGSSTKGPWPGMEQIIVGMGCFWGAEKVFWAASGVISTQVGYAAGFTPNATYRELCSGRTGHNEVVRVVFDPTVTCLSDLLKLFWEGHDPTQGMGQGNDRGTQYRSGIYVFSEAQRVAAEESRAAFGAALKSAGHAAVTTEILEAPPFYFAEDDHQQYLHKNKGGYCGLGGTGLTCPNPLIKTEI